MHIIKKCHFSKHSFSHFKKLATIHLKESQKCFFGDFARPSPVLEFLFEKVVKERKSPCFEVYSSQIEIIDQPMDYYLALNKLIMESEQRISMSSLYFGTGKLEKFLLERINKKMENNRTIHVNLVVDYLRGQRIENNLSTFQLLHEIRTQHLQNKNVNFCFMLMPGIGVRKGLKLNNGIGEIFGVQHIKINVFDNNVLLTGLFIFEIFINAVVRANFSESYFTNRRDRCYVIENCEPLANYLDDLIKTMGSLSFHILDGSNLVMQNKYPEPWKNPEKFKDVFLHQLKFFRYLHRTQIPLGYDLKMDQYFDLEDPEETQHQKQQTQSQNSEFVQTQKFQINDEEDNTNIKTRKDHNYEAIFQQKIQDFKKRSQNHPQKNKFGELFLEPDQQDIPEHFKKNKIPFTETSLQKKQMSDLTHIGGRVFIFPTIQCGPINFNEDEEIFLDLLKEVDSPNTRIQMATGYMNFTKKYINTISSTQSQYEILTASPQANGFYKGGFLKKYIPYFYRIYEYRLLKYQHRKKKSNLKLFEFQREGWTFHGKGMWLYEKGRPHPSLGIIGSSNFGIRSSQRDLEAQFYIYSECPKFNERLNKEAKDLFEDSSETNLKSIKKDKEMKIGFIKRIFAKLFETFL